MAGLLRDGLEEGERGPAVCGCGAPGYDVETVTLKRRASGAGVSGVYRCDSPWLCPTCAPGRALRRRERLEEVLRATETRGGCAAFVTLTIRHDLDTPLAQAKRVVSAASRRARQGKAWVAAQARAGLLGVIQGVEVTHGRRSGWHYHVHLLIPATGAPEAVLDEAQALVRRYIAAVRAEGGDALDVGQDVQIVRDGEAARYASKGSASWEVAGGAKEARAAASRTPWDLATLAAAGDEQARGLFAEYAAVMPGTRSCVVSAALAAKLGLEADGDDDEPGEQDLEEDGVDAGAVPAPTWGRVLRRGVAWRVLAAVEAREPREAVEALAARLGAPPPPPPPRVEPLDADRVAREALARGWGRRSTAGRSTDLGSVVADAERRAARRGMRLDMSPEALAAAQRAFIEAGLARPL